ncbi:MAG TPA: mechanosensitive ion channel family protein [Methylomirabilota bacterium]|nr:mechanosensitive ion channel family protein [Methylomirabilota bacterium]
MNQERWSEWVGHAIMWAEQSPIFRILVVLLFALLGLYAVRLAMKRLYQALIWRNEEDIEIQKRGQTLTSFVRYTLATAIIAVSFITILKEVGLDIRPILTGAGIVGLAVGFGAQNLVADIISGIFILLEDQVRVGDVVNLKGKGGLVEKIGLRTIQLRDLEGAVHYVRNGQVDIVTNMTKGFSNYVIELAVALDTNVDAVMDIFRQVDGEMRADERFKADILKPMDIFGIERLTDSGIVVRARTTTKPLRQWDIGREFLKRIKVRFDQQGISLAHPQRTFHIPKEFIDAIKLRETAQ